MSSGMSPSLPMDAPTPSQTSELASSARLAIEDLIGVVVRLGASDLHLKPDSPPILRVHGALGKLDEYGTLSKEDVLGLLYHILLNPSPLERLHRTGPVDFAYDSHQKVRFRVNAFQERGQFSI